MRRFPYHFDHGGPVTQQGVPVGYSRTLSFTEPTVITPAGVVQCKTLLIVWPSGDGAYAYTNDPDYEWAYYRAECHDQARRIVRQGLHRALPWLRDPGAT